MWSCGVQPSLICPVFKPRKARPPLMMSNSKVSFCEVTTLKCPSTAAGVGAGAGEGGGEDDGGATTAPVPLRRRPLTQWKPYRRYAVWYRSEHFWPALKHLKLP